MSDLPCQFVDRVPLRSIDPRERERNSRIIHQDVDGAELFGQAVDEAALEFDASKPSS